MCVIAIKTKGQAFPSMECIKNCVEKNPDGFSMAWNEKGEICVYKTMNPSHFLKKYEKLTKRLSPETTGMVMHMRIATHGSKGIKNCHCWLGSGLAFAHNGILHDVECGKDMTDSESFFRFIFEPIYNKCGWKVVERVIKGIIGTSKFAFIDNKGDIHMYGHYESHEGIWYSNSSYKVFKFEPFGYLGDYYGGRGYYGSRGYYGTKYNKTKVETENDYEF